MPTVIRFLISWNSCSRNLSEEPGDVSWNSSWMMHNMKLISDNGASLLVASMDMLFCLLFKLLQMRLLITVIGVIRIKRKVLHALTTFMHYVYLIPHVLGSVSFFLETVQGVTSFLWPDLTRKTLPLGHGQNQSRRHVIGQQLVHFCAKGENVVFILFKVRTYLCQTGVRAQLSQGSGFLFHLSFHLPLAYESWDFEYFCRHYCCMTCVWHGRINIFLSH